MLIIRNLLFAYQKQHFEPNVRCNQNKYTDITFNVLRCLKNEIWLFLFNIICCNKPIILPIREVKNYGVRLLHGRLTPENSTFCWLLQVRDSQMVRVSSSKHEAFRSQLFFRNIVVCMLYIYKHITYSTCCIKVFYVNGCHTVGYEGWFGWSGNDRSVVQKYIISFICYKTIMYTIYYIFKTGL